MKTLLLVTLIFFNFNSFAQKKEKREVNDDSYGSKSLMIQEQKPVDLKLPGQYLKKAGNSFATSMLITTLTAVAGSVVSKKSQRNANIIYIGGGLVGFGCFLSGATYLTKAGDELDRYIMQK